MRTQLVLGYTELFGGPPPAYNELLEGTPTKAIVAYWSAITNVLQLREDSIETQAFIYRAVSQNFPPIVSELLAQRLVYYRRIHKQFSIFTARHVVGFLFRLLRNFRDFEQIVIPPNEELNVFKAYLCYIDEVNESDNKKLEIILDARNLQDKDWFGRMIWPYMIKQFEFTYPLDIFYEGLKGLAFATFLQSNQEYAPHLVDFLAKTKTAEPVQYVGGLLQLIKANFDAPNRDTFQGFFQLFRFNPDEPVLSDLVFDPNKNRVDDPEKSDYLDLKERPIVHFEDDKHVVPYWGYVYQALFIGLVFAFYRRSSIQKVKKKFEDFTSTIGSEFAERWLFRKLMQTSFNHKHSCLAFPSKDEFNPDCYYRKGKRVYLFEFKDSLLNKDVIHSFSYEEIKLAIDTKLAQKSSDRKRNKGIYQLSRLFEQLAKDSECTLEFDQSIKGPRLKASKLTVYPVLVHTNKYFDLPGVNQYLQELFSESIAAVDSPFSDVRPLTVVNMQYLFQRMQLFRDRKIDLGEKINAYHHEVARRMNKANRTGDPNDRMDTYPSFNEFELKDSEYKQYKRENMVKSAFQCWDVIGKDGPNIGS